MKLRILLLFIFVILFLGCAAVGETAKELVLHTFCQGSCFDGRNPQGALLLDGSGNLFGATQDAGSGSGGTIFELSPLQSGWNFLILYSFQFGTGDGSFPNGSLIFDPSGNLYGTTSKGGTFGRGVVFELSPSNGGWNETILYSFGGVAGDGEFPAAGLTLDQSGNLYGTAFGGGNTTGNCSSSGCGIVFELSPSAGGKWNETILYTFQGGNDGSSPQSTLVFDAKGNLYGTTLAGAGDGCTLLRQIGCGTVFELSPGAGGIWKETILHAFSGGEDGAAPAAGVVFNSTGDLFGTAQGGGIRALLNCNPALPPDDGCGVVYRLSPGSHGWTETVIYGFQGNFDGNTDGFEPLSSVVFDKKGRIYGTTFQGGMTWTQDRPRRWGILFRLSPAGDNEWKEERFLFLADGGAFFPTNPVVIDTNGNVYGGSLGGPPNNAQGVVYELVPAP